MTDFSQRLVRWYRLHRRELPWREHRNPYAIWLSEVLLQQTRVEQGLPYYERFLDRFPTVEALASASLEEVLQVWQGLGYYSRARNMHRAAQTIVRDWSGQWKTEVSDWLALPGVGPYTAGAVASIAFGTRATAVDGNVYRVLSRWAEIEAPVDQREGQKMIAELAESLLPEGDCSDHTQALMELGSLVCTPRSPRCHECPLALDCRVAHNKKRAESLPVKAGRTRVTQEDWHRAVLIHEGRLLVRQRPTAGIWPGLMDLPEWVPRTESLKFNAPTQPTPDTVHRLSHRLLHLYFHAVSTDVFGSISDDYQWVELNSLGDLAWPVPLRRWLEKNSTFGRINP